MMNARKMRLPSPISASRCFEQVYLFGRRPNILHAPVLRETVTRAAYPLEAKSCPLSSCVFGQADSGERRYAGALILLVSAGAAGTFTVEFHPANTKTLLTDVANVAFPLIGLAPGLITITGP